MPGAPRRCSSAAVPPSTRPVLGEGERPASGMSHLADRLELTFVEGAFAGDTFFPPYQHLLEENGGPFQRVTFAERHEAEALPDGSRRPAFRFETFVRGPD